MNCSVDTDGTDTFLPSILFLSERGFSLAVADDEQTEAVRSRYNEIFARSVENSVLNRCWKEVFLDEYPDEVEPYSFTTRSELVRIVQEFNSPPSATLGDLGCGRGGPGLWVAQALEASLIGIDLSSRAIEHAEGRVAKFGLENRARFFNRDLSSTGLPSGSLDGVLSIEALLFLPDKEAAVSEVARILKPGGRFIFTSIDYLSTPQGGIPQLADHRPVLEKAGFDVVTYEAMPNFKEIASLIYDKGIDSYEELTQEQGREFADKLVKDFQTQKANLETVDRRVFAIATNRAI